MEARVLPCGVACSTASRINPSIHADNVRRSLAAIRSASLFTFGVVRIRIFAVRLSETIIHLIDIVSARLYKQPLTRCQGVSQ